MKWVFNNKKLHQDFVKSNLQDWTLVLSEASRANKGRHSHDINRDSYRLGECLKRAKKKALMRVTIEEITEMGKFANHISYCLMLARLGR